MVGAPGRKKIFLEEILNRTPGEIFGGISPEFFVEFSGKFQEVFSRKNIRKPLKKFMKAPIKKFIKNLGESLSDITPVTCELRYPRIR